MVCSTRKITVIFVWVALVREVFTQDQTIPDSSSPEILNMMLGANEASENDAIEMGRNAAEDMGALMASPPMKIYRPPQSSGRMDEWSREYGSHARDAELSSEFGGYQYARDAEVSPCQRDGAWNSGQPWEHTEYSPQDEWYSGRPSQSFSDTQWYYNSPQDAQWYPNSEQSWGRFGANQDSQWYPSEPADGSQDMPHSGKLSGRAAVPRTIPLAPLPQLPFIAGVSPFPMLSPLIQSLTNPSRLGLGFGARPLLRTSLPYATTKSPLALKSSLPLRTSSPTYRLPRLSKVWIPPPLRTVRSSYTPSNYARSPNQHKPLVFYA